MKQSGKSKAQQRKERKRRVMGIRPRSMVILSDSICRGLPVDSNNVQISCHPGINLQRMSKFVAANPALVENSTCVVVHCGTNDLQRISPGQVVQQMQHLKIQLSAMTQARVVIAGILPRLDSKNLTQKAMNINTMAKIKLGADYFICRR